MLFAASGSAQDFKIRAKVDLVVVPVTVKGSGDKLITGLTKDDFIIYEDGQRQTITNFSIDPTPLSAAIIVDTGLSPGSLAKVQKTLTALAGAFSEFDEVAVYRYDKFIYTSARLLAGPRAHRDSDERDSRCKSGPAISRHSTRRSVLDSWSDDQRRGGCASRTTRRHRDDAAQTVESAQRRDLHAAADLSKRDRNRRKMVLVISDGDTTGSTHSFDETSQSLLEKDVQVYAIGLDQPFPFKNVSVLKEYAKSYRRRRLLCRFPAKHREFVFNGHRGSPQSVHPGLYFQQ